MEQQPGSQTQFSPDGKWFWDGQQWRSALSSDGRWRWDGQSWQPVEQAGAGGGAVAAAGPPNGPDQPAPGAAAQAGQVGAQSGVSGAGPTSSPNIQFDHSLVTTAFGVDGMRVARNLGVVRGIIVRSRSVVGNIGAGVQQLFGGNISIFTELCEQSRRDAYELMIQHAAALGANAVIGMRYDATELTQGVTEVLAYGTAVVLEKA